MFYRSQACKRLLYKQSLVASAQRVRVPKASLETPEARCCRHSMAATEADAKPAEANNAEKRQPATLEEDDEFEEFEEESACKPCSLPPALAHDTSSPSLQCLRIYGSACELRV